MACGSLTRKAQSTLGAVLLPGRNLTICKGAAVSVGGGEGLGVLLRGLGRCAPSCSKPVVLAARWQGQMVGRAQATASTSRTCVAGPLRLPAPAWLRL